MIWSSIEKYNRDLLLSQLSGKTLKRADIVKMGKEWGFKDSTMNLKIARWTREKRITKDKNGNYKLSA